LEQFKFVFSNVVLDLAYDLLPNHTYTIATKNVKWPNGYI